MSSEGGNHHVMIDCDEVVSRLPALVAGDLDANKLGEIRVHTRSCAECAHDVRQSETLSHLLDSLAKRCGETAISRTAPASPGRSLLPQIQQDAHRVASWSQVESNVGTLYLAATDYGLCRVWFPETQPEQIEQWCERQNLIPLYDEDELAPYAQQVQEYLDGRRRTFALPVDLRTATPFQRSVLHALQAIPYGDLRNYREIAGQVGNPQAQRAVGNAVKRNPVPIVIPCHRVIRTDGTIGGYAGGPNMKERLLKLEGALLAS